MLNEQCISDKSQILKKEESQMNYHNNFTAEKEKKMFYPLN